MATQLPVTMGGMAMILSGRLSDWSVNELLSIMQVTKKTASLEIEGERRHGFLYFETGNLIDAETVPTPPGLDVTSESAPSRIIDVVYVLSLIGDGTFAIGDRRPPAPTPNGLEAPAVLAEVETRLAAEAEIRAEGIDEDTPVGFGSVSSEPVIVSPEVWGLITQISPQFSLAELEWRMGRSQAISILQSLHQSGLLAIGGSSVESSPAAPEPGYTPDPDEFGSPGSVEVDTVAASTNGDAPDGDPLPALDDVFGAEGSEPKWWDERDGEAAVEISTDGEAVDLAKPRKPVKVVTSDPDTTLVPGVLSELNRRFRVGEEEV